VIIRQKTGRIRYWPSDTFNLGYDLADFLPPTEAEDVAVLFMEVGVQFEWSWSPKSAAERPRWHGHRMPESLWTYRNL